VMQVAVLGVASQLVPNIVHQLKVLRPEAR